jgi:hypothetical protein
MADFASITPSFATAPALLLSAATETPVTAADPINTGAHAVDIKREEVTHKKIAIREGFILTVTVELVGQLACVRSILLISIRKLRFS